MRSPLLGLDFRWLANDARVQQSYIYVYIRVHARIYTNINAYIHVDINLHRYVQRWLRKGSCPNWVVDSSALHLPYMQMPALRLLLAMSAHLTLQILILIWWRICYMNGHGVHLSAPALQTLALTSYNEQVKLLEKLGLSKDFANTSLRKLASLGAFGKFQNKCNAELRTYLGEPDTPAPVLQQVPLLVMKPQPGQPTKIIHDLPIFFAACDVCALLLYEQRQIQRIISGKSRG